MAASTRGNAGAPRINELGLGKWCRLRDSNTRPPHYECDALPTELRRLRALPVRPLRTDSAAGQGSPWTPQTPTFPRPTRRVTATLVTVLVLVAAGAALLVGLVALARHGKTPPTPTARTRKEAPKSVRKSSTEDTPPRTAKPLLPEGLSHKEDRIVRTRDRAEVIFVPAGKYLSGQDEREVIVAGFYIDKCEVTNAQFTRFLQATEYAPERLKAPDLAEREEDRPVLGVTHVDAGQYAKWAGAGLPTAREWEKAARGTDGRRYPWGDGLPKKKLAVFGRDAAKGAPDAVGAHPEGASPYGVMDLAGNALEWIANGRAMGGHYASTSRSIVVIVAPGKPAGDAGADVLFCGFRCVVRVKTAAPGDKAPDKTADAEGKD